MNTNITKTWTLTINEDNIFARCTNESLYQAYARTEENLKGDMVVMQDDDRDQFKAYYNVAIADLTTILARRLDYPVSAYDNITSFNLLMHDNHDDIMASVLATHCIEYVIKKVLEQWYRADFGAELERLEINHCLHYRKNPVRRRVSPLI